MEEENKLELVQSLIDTVNEMPSTSDYRSTVKKQYCNMARRLKLLTPMFEEIRESKEAIPEETVSALLSLKEALDSAKELLRFGSEGSKIYLVLEREQIMNKFHDVINKLEQALSGISYENLDISDEVKEQVELVLTQFRRAKGRADSPNVGLYEDLLSLSNKTNDAATDPAVLRRLSEILQLTGIADLTQESLALHEMVAASGGDPGESIEKMSMLLKKIKDFVQTENPNLDGPGREKNLPPSGSGQLPSEGNVGVPVIPDDFRCPISLELMKDPVIVKTGQTYERSCIEKWLDAGHGTCPKTQQTLTNTVLTPNYVLRSLIAQWCEANGVEPPKRPSSSRPSKTTSSCSPAERTKIEILLCKLTSGNPEDQRSAAGEIRLLAKRNADNRVAIAEAGAIRPLVELLSTSDSRTQEHAVTALLNLSICEDNKGSIITSGAVPGIVHVLKKGSMEARENAAATLFSLSVVDDNKVTIGASGAIPPLVTLLSEGTQRGKKDAATALFNLCIYQGNKGKAVRAGVVPILMRLLTEPGGGMVDEALAILAVLASHPEGKAAIGAADAVPVLVDVIGNGSPRNRENAAAVLVYLFSADQKYLVEAQELGVMGSLLDLAQNGTDRGKRKALQLLERLSRFVGQQKEAHAQAEAQSQAQQPRPSSTANTVDS
ncbi:U-box domain-containing protein 13-like [Tripterygium wilfordii]|uniref:RING-type E3 ubiquitin transferase n=1 Tax=Tripterygium wilfordii TaxID=458696 RepID=A0A7J7DYM2_TRIWF|nr:U-box domain-containing protein 13-like [Tripterygium wilfordii]KAF5751468.1 U-box domain-containing protein 13-like [Tripterygium wilfordii]